MSPLDISTKTKIIETTLSLIDQKPVHLLSVREIAKSAEVNVAAINYYFGSKEALIKEVMEYYYSQSKEVFALLGDEERSPGEVLMEFCQEFMKLTMTYPGLIRNNVSQYLLESVPRPEVEECIGEEVSLLTAIIQKTDPAFDKKTALFKAIQIYAGLIYPMLMVQYGPGILKMDIKNNKVIKDYIRVLLTGVYDPDAS